MPENTAIIEMFLNTAKEWYEGKRAKNGSMYTNVMNVGLIVSGMLADGLPIDDARLSSSKKSQVRGLSGDSVARVLKMHGETRLFTREGGRTSRGTLPLAVEYRDKLNSVHLPEDQPIKLGEIAVALESFFTQCIRQDYFDKQRITVDIEPTKPVSFIIFDILKAASERSDKPTGAVLQHLVGAKLQLRFPNEDVGQDQANAADIQTGREGDFQIGTTAFHVTVAPMEKLVARCVENRRSGYRPVILTLGNKVLAARQMIENVDMSHQILVQAAEEFIGTNIEEIAVYDGDQIRGGVARLVRTYNERIQKVEVDKSLMIDEPAWVIKVLSKS